MGLEACRLGVTAPLDEWLETFRKVRFQLGSAQGPCVAQATQLHGDLRWRAAALGVEHVGVSCNLCGESPLRGVRYKCISCPDCDVCRTCRDLHAHRVFVRLDRAIDPRWNEVLTLMTLSGWLVDTSSYVQSPPAELVGQLQAFLTAGAASAATNVSGPDAIARDWNEACARQEATTKADKLIAPPYAANDGGSTVECDQLPDDVLGLVMDAALRLGASTDVRLVCSQWRACHDARVVRLPHVQRATRSLKAQLETSDDTLHALVRRFPAAACLDLSCGESVRVGSTSSLTVSNHAALRADIGHRFVTNQGFRSNVGHRLVTDHGLRAVVSGCGSLTHLNLTGCTRVTSDGLRAVSSLTTLNYLNLTRCLGVTAEGLRAVSSLPALTHLDLTCCRAVTDDALRAVSSLTTLNHLNLTRCTFVANEGLRAVSSLPALTHLDLACCANVTDAGLRAVSSCATLTHLNLTCSRVTSGGLGAVSDLPALTHLNVTRSRFGDGNVQAVMRLPALAFLDVSQTAVTQRNLVALRNFGDARGLNVVGDSAPTGFLVGGVGDLGLGNHNHHDCTSSDDALAKNLVMDKKQDGACACAAARGTSWQVNLPASHPPGDTGVVSGWEIAN
jgi:hypothetical protein